MTSTELRVINHYLTRLLVRRWSSDKVLGHVSIELPAPIFDVVHRDLLADVHLLNDSVQLTRKDNRTIFVFEGVTYKRVDGTYWKVDANEGTEINGAKES
jgi:hypothetical protein